MQLCVMNCLLHEHADAISSLKSALSQSLRELARLYIEHRFITANEAFTFMAEVPTINDSITEPQAQGYRSTFRQTWVIYCQIVRDWEENY